MAVCIASDLSKDMVGNPLFRGVSFKLERRERLTLSGRNGSGKTTLLRMLAGETGIDGGDLVFAKGTKVALHDQRPPREHGMSLRDYVLTGCAELLALEDQLAALEGRMAEGDYEERTLDAYSRAQARLEHAGGYNWRDGVTATLTGLGFGDGDLDRDLGTFSGGELTRASLARALAGDPDLLLLDEPTNHLDIASLEWLEQRLQTLDAAIVLVAHDRWFLEAVGTAVLELEAGRARFFPGTWHAWRKEQAQRELALGRAIDKQQAEIARLERFVTRFRAGTRSKQAQSRQKRLDKVDRIERDPRDGDGLGFGFKAPERSGRVIFDMEDATVRIGERTLLEHADLWLERGEHLSLIGPNGSGKSTLISALTGQRPLDGGVLRGGHNVKLGVLAQHAETLDETAKVVEACQRATGLTPGKARHLPGRLLFSGGAAEKPVAGLSGGERQRLALAVLVASGANVLILDEPTNHLDIESREALEDALSAFPGTVLLITHDRALLDAVGTRTVSVEDGTLRTYQGGWAEYLRLREEEKAAPAPAPKPAARANGNGKANGKPEGKAKANGKANGKPKANGAAPAAPAPSKNARKRAERLETEIERAEAALAAVEEELADPSAWNDPRTSAKSTQRHEEAKARVEALYSELEAAGV